MDYHPPSVGGRVTEVDGTLGAAHAANANERPPGTPPRPLSWRTSFRNQDTDLGGEQ